MVNQLVAVYEPASLTICARTWYEPLLRPNSTYVTIVDRLVAKAFNMLCAFPFVIGMLFGSK